MKRKALMKRTISIILATMLAFGVCAMPAVFAMSTVAIGCGPAVQLPDGYEAVAGRILPAARAGDTSDWIEIARYNGNSLLVRSNYINIYPNGHTNDPKWQYTSYGTSNKYSDSMVRKYINNWFNGTTFGTAEKLPANARLRSFTVSSSALQKLGTNCYAASMTNGLSVPSTNMASSGNDVAFALSYSESANFMSWGYFRRDLYIASTKSSEIPTSNANKINLNNPLMAKYTQELYGMWFRTPGDLSSTAGALAFGGDGRAFQFQISGSSEAGLVYPAVWVRSSAFVMPE